MTDDHNPTDATAAAQDRQIVDAWVTTPPRRTDAAFARSVASAVQERRAKRRWAMPLSLAAVATGALVFVLVNQTTEPAPTPSGNRFALNLSATAQTIGDEAPASLSDAALVALAQDTGVDTFDAVSALDPSGYAIVDDTEFDIDGGDDFEIAALIDDDSDEAGDGDALVDVGDADDTTLLAMADLFVIPANSPYKF